MLGIEEGIVLKRPVFEWHYKSDALADPLINDDHMATCWMNVKKGVEDGSITEEGGVPCV